MDEPVTRYARTSDGLHIAYRVLGGGPIDLLYAPPFVSHVEMYWEEPFAVDFLERLASFARLIVFDKRGTGLSDRPDGDRAATLEQRSEDIRAVLDAVDSERATLFGVSESGPMCLLFAASHPDRTSALVLFSTTSRALSDDDYPFGEPIEAVEPDLAAIERQWLEGRWDLTFRIDGATPTEIARVERWFARICRSSASPAAAVAMERLWWDIDVRAVLPTISAPTLCLARSGDAQLASTRYIADRIPGARFLELPGAAHNPFLGSLEPMMADIEEFLTGLRPREHPNRVLTTIVFVDMVGSTQLAADLGDARWTGLLDSFLARLRKDVARFGGREIDVAGDGMLVSFDGPARAVRFALAAVASAKQMELGLRAGVHTGECEIVGERLQGIAVHTGARIAALAGDGEVLVSGTVRDLTAGSGIQFEDAGDHELKGVPGTWRLMRAS